MPDLPEQAAAPAVLTALAAAGLPVPAPAAAPATPAPAPATPAPAPATPAPAPATPAPAPATPAPYPATVALPVPAAPVMTAAAATAPVTPVAPPAPTPAGPDAAESPPAAVAAAPPAAAGGTAAGPAAAHRPPHPEQPGQTGKAPARNQTAAPVPVGAPPAAEQSGEAHSFDALLKRAAERAEAPAAAPAAPPAQVPPAEPPATADPPEAPLSPPVADAAPTHAQSPAAPEVTGRGTPDGHALANQMANAVRHAGLSTDGSGRSEIRMQLVPEHLGEVTLKLVVEDGQVRADIVVARPEVKAALESQMGFLKDRLQQQGLDVGALAVTVGQSGTEADPRHGSRWAGGRRPKVQPPGRPVGEETDAVPAPVAAPALQAYSAWRVGRRFSALA